VEAQGGGTHGGATGGAQLERGGCRGDEDAAVKTCGEPKEPLPSPRGTPARPARAVLPVAARRVHSTRRRAPRAPGFARACNSPLTCLPLTLSEEEEEEEEEGAGRRRGRAEEGSGAAQGSCERRLALAQAIVRSHGACHLLGRTPTVLPDARPLRHPHRAGPCSVQLRLGDLTPLDVACLRGDARMVRALLELAPPSPRVLFVARPARAALRGPGQRGGGARRALPPWPRSRASRRGRWSSSRRRCGEPGDAVAAACYQAPRGPDRRPAAGRPAGRGPAAAAAAGAAVAAGGRRWSFERAAEELEVRYGARSWATDGETWAAAAAAQRRVVCRPRGRRLATQGPSMPLPPPERVPRVQRDIARLLQAWDAACVAVGLCACCRGGHCQELWPRAAGGCNACSSSGSSSSGRAAGQGWHVSCGDPRLPRWGGPGAVRPSPAPLCAGATASGGRSGKRAPPSGGRGALRPRAPEEQKGRGEGCWPASQSSVGGPRSSPHPSQTCATPSGPRPSCTPLRRGRGGPLRSCSGPAGGQRSHARGLR